jgi:hypothetical protein
MSKKIWVLVLSFLFPAIIFGTIADAEIQSGPEEEGAPVISQSFASQKIRPGDTWKIYLNVSNPDGELRNIFAIVEQPGIGPYPLSIIRIKEENRKELSGYIYLHTSTAADSLDFITLTLTVNVQDRAGNFSQPVVFPLSLGPRFTQEAPPQGIFKEQELGPVMVTLRTKRDGNNTSPIFAP